MQNQWLRVLLWSYIARAVPVLRSDTSGSDVVRSPTLASSEPPAAPAATSTHLMFQPVCVPPPAAAPQTPLELGVALLMVRVGPPYIASVWPIIRSPALCAAT